MPDAESKVPVMVPWSVKLSTSWLLSWPVVIVTVADSIIVSSISEVLMFPVNPTAIPFSRKMAGIASMLLRAGASLAGTISTIRLRALLASSPSLMVKETVRSSVEGLLPVFR